MVRPLQLLWNKYSSESFVVIFLVFIFSMPSKVIKVVIEFIFLGINIFWVFLRADFTTSICNEDLNPLFLHSQVLCLHNIMLAFSPLWLASLFILLLYCGFIISTTWRVWSFDAFPMFLFVMQLKYGHLFNAYSKWRDVRFFKAFFATNSKWFFERSLEVKDENLLYPSDSTRAMIGQFCGSYSTVRPAKARYI